MFLTLREHTSAVDHAWQTYKLAIVDGGRDAIRHAQHYHELRVQSLRSALALTWRKEDDRPPMIVDDIPQPPTVLAPQVHTTQTGPSHVMSMDAGRMTDREWPDHITGTPRKGTP